jgi:LPS sulfotransferase NodH
LAATGVAGKPESYFRLPDEPSYAEAWGVRRGPDGPLDYREYVGAAIVAGSTSNGVFGARVMWGTMDEVVAKLRAAHGHQVGTDLEVIQPELGETRFVHLYRRDVVAQAVSWAKAEQTGCWQDGDSVVPGRRPMIDIDDIDRYVGTIREHNLAWREWFDTTAVVPLVVSYEDLVADMAGTVGRITHFLGLELPAGHVAEPLTHRQADGANRYWAERYRAQRPLEF